MSVVHTLQQAGRPAGWSGCGHLCVHTNHWVYLAAPPHARDVDVFGVVHFTPNLSH